MLSFTFSVLYPLVSPARRVGPAATARSSNTSCPGRTARPGTGARPAEISAQTRHALTPLASPVKISQFHRVAEQRCRCLTAGSVAKRFLFRHRTAGMKGSDMGCKLLYSKRNGTFLTQEPLCCAVLCAIWQSWVRGRAGDLIRAPGNRSKPQPILSQSCT